MVIVVTCVIHIKDPAQLKACFSSAFLLLQCIIFLNLLFFTCVFLYSRFVHVLTF